MHPPSSLLRVLLLVSVVFFLCMGTAHFIGLKWPLLFVYFDTPYYAYQDKIIAFTLVTYASLFFAASRHRLVVPYALVSIWITVAGLAAVNLSGDLAAVLSGQGTWAYWLQTGLFGGLAAVMTALFVTQKEHTA